MEKTKRAFPFALLTVQIILLGLYAGFADYSDVKSVSTNYPHFQDVHVMIFVGIAYLLSFLKKYGYGALSYNLLIGAVTIQWAILINTWVKQRIKKEEGHYHSDVGDVKISLDNMLGAEFTAATVLISFCTVVGKISPMQMLVIAMLEPIFFAINETVLMEYLKVSDAGGSIVVHLFGGYFGLAVAAVIRNYGNEHENESSVYHSDMFGMIGTLFLWVYWPSFNAGFLTQKLSQHNRAITNTYLSLAGSVVVTYFISIMVNKKYKLNMAHIQNATLAGGVAVGATCNLMIKPWGAILIGMIAGGISTLGFAYLTPFMTKKLNIHDTCGVHNLHGTPGVFGGIAAAIAVVSIGKEKYPPGDYIDIYPNGRSKWEQGGYQFAAVCVGFGIAVAGGVITGLIAKFSDRVDEMSLFNDEHEFEMPIDHYVRNENLEMKDTNCNDRVSSNMA